MRVSKGLGRLRSSLKRRCKLFQRASGTVLAKTLGLGLGFWQFLAAPERVVKVVSGAARKTLFKCYTPLKTVHMAKVRKFQESRFFEYIGGGSVLG